MRTLNEGVRIWVDHERTTAPSEDHPGKVKLLARGGRTTVKLFSESNEETLLSLGYARCHAADNYNRKLGVEIALGRAMKLLKEQKEAGTWYESEQLEQRAREIALETNGG